MERTFIAIKPDGVQRKLIGEIIARFEKKGYKLVAMKYIVPKRELAAKHYEEHKGKGFYEGLLDFITSGPIVAMVWQGKGVIATARKMIGQTKPLESECGSIRGDFGIEVGRNIIHGSDSLDSAEREIGIWFSEEEIFDYESSLDNWVYEK
ncbi:nucleoside diphosphate kinase [Anaeramoeba flamelloides]|uniref:Nucleoside diphosphate kinase n=1 Tax=Anaeramoeba flamelloides TaxID=1746091 RepID=A0AAV7ZJN5_9EUKA|nr:nucleoside diphosphate kinase cytosolic [Anaeramoeba flamelloides]KAJ6232402.1 nucleoside diphosphate kinase [Anaeramoeba flamelloides]